MIVGIIYILFDCHWTRVRGISVYDKTNESIIVQLKFMYKNLYENKKKL